MAVKERKYYESKLESLIAERAVVLCLARDFHEQAQFVGYLNVVNDAGEDVFYITLKNDHGEIGNVTTKSKSVISQINEIMDVMDGEDRTSFTIGFQEKQTKKGNTCIVVTMGLGYADRHLEAEGSDSED